MKQLLPQFLITFLPEVRGTGASGIKKNNHMKNKRKRLDKSTKRKGAGDGSDPEDMQSVERTAPQDRKNPASRKTKKKKPKTRKTASGMPSRGSSPGMSLAEFTVLMARSATLLEFILHLLALGYRLKVSGGHVCIHDVVTNVTRRLTTLCWDADFHEHLIRWRRIDFNGAAAASRRMLNFQLEWIYGSDLTSEIPAERLVDFIAFSIIGRRLDHSEIVKRVKAVAPGDPLGALLQCADRYSAYFNAEFWPDDSVDFFLYPLTKTAEEPSEYFMAKYHRFLIGEDPRDLNLFDYLPEDLSQATIRFRSRKKRTEEENGKGGAERDGV